MAIRKIRVEGDEILRMKCKPVKEVSDSLRSLIGDMFDTMYDANGVGLAAPQIGIVKRIVVIDDGAGHRFTFLNPVIEKREGEQLFTEGCLSLPGFAGEVKRPQSVTVRALDENGQEVVVSAEGHLAVIFCHEIDHLDGILYKDVAHHYFPVEQEESGEGRRRRSGRR